MNIKLHYRISIALISLLILLTLVQNTYAKYVTSASASTDITIARWNILINNVDITSNNNFTNAITPIFPGNEHIASGIIAPTSEGYFDLIIDYSRVDVSFNSTIEIMHDDTNTISDLMIIGYSIDGGEIVPVNSTNATIEGIVLLTEVRRTKSIRVHVEWLDGATMTNAEQTEATKDGVASLRVNASFIQRPN